MDSPAAKSLSRASVVPSTHDTLVTVIVTHFNYAHVVERALQSVAQQTHRNLECVIVDDGSQPTHLKKLRDVISRLSDKRFRLVPLAKNIGQTAALFEGLRKSTGAFVALLDPDDLYEPHFIETMLRCHLNPVAYAAVAACDMALYRVGGGRLTGTYSRFRKDALADGTLARAEASMLDFGFSKYYPPETPGWLWCTTSSLMIRRDALTCLARRSYMPDLKICADTYCVMGAHMLGGTLFVDQALSWRGIHADNAVEVETLISAEQRRHKPSFVDTSRTIKLFAARTLIENKGFRKLPDATLARVLNGQFSKKELDGLLRGNDDMLEVFVHGNGA
jgi:glycosyltransferase involved in cell wall biosynthesis